MLVPRPDPLSRFRPAENKRTRYMPGTPCLPRSSSLGFDAGLPPGHGTFGKRALTSVQGQKISFDSANSIREMITASPPAIRMRNALSDGGRPVTASNA